MQTGNTNTNTNIYMDIFMQVVSTTGDVLCGHDHLDAVAGCDRSSSLSISVGSVARSRSADLDPDALLLLLTLAARLGTQ